MPQIYIGAHRGAMCHAPENTLAAFEKAIEFGAYRIECDIRKSKDGHLLMMHDATLDRTTDGTGDVHEMTLAEIQEAKAGGIVPIPTLKDTLECAKDRCKLLLELKATDIAEQVVQEVEETGMVEESTVIAFDTDSLKRARQVNPKIPIGYFHLQPGEIDPAAVIEEFDASLLVVWPKAAVPEVITAAKDAGFYVRCGFGDNMTYEESFEEFKRMVEMGVDEVSCGRPDWIAKMIEEYA